jgi:cytochrome P450
MNDLHDSSFFSPQILENPFDYFDSVRVSAPVKPILQPGKNRPMFLVTSYSLLQEIMQDPVTYSSHWYEIMADGAGCNPEAVAIYKGGWPEIDTLVTGDPPEHGRYRSLAMKAFLPKRIAAMEPRIIEAINFLIDRFIERGECDFLREFAAPLPIYMISDVFGIDRSLFKSVWRWVDFYLVRNGQMGTHDQEIEAAHGIVECQRFLYDLIQQRRRVRSEDMVSDLVHAEIAGHEPLNDIEILSMLQIILIGGVETTRNVMVGMMARLLGRDRDQYDLLRGDRTLVPMAVEEALRLEPPAPVTWRITTRDVEFAGVRVPKGSTLMLRIDAANRDMAAFDRPAKFDVARPITERHLSFGTGIHFCIGQGLARRELNMVLPCLLDRLENMQLVPEKSDLRIHTSVIARGMRELYITFDPGRPLGTGIAPSLEQ